ncbi:MAG: hypothetical protein LCH93_10025 [Proteobacteria bacterium]|nr:hypothetical protein [Pseudomonadota bacterium]
MITDAKKVAFSFIFLLVSSVSTHGQMASSYFSVPDISTLKTQSLRPPLVEMLGTDPGVFRLSFGKCQMPDDVMQVQPTTDPPACYVRMATPYSIGRSETTNGILVTDRAGYPLISTKLPPLTFSTLSHIAKWPTSLGSVPMSIASINHGDYPTKGMIPAGVLQQNVASMVVPTTYTQQPWPAVNFAGYSHNQGRTAGQSAVNFFSVATVTAPNAHGANFNGVISNGEPVDAFAGQGRGHDFGTLVGYEVNPNIWKVGSSEPQGTLDGLRLIGGGDDVRPAGGAFGVRVFPLSGYGGPSPTYWNYLFFSEDGAASSPENESAFASIGATGIGNGVHSQSIRGRARTPAGKNIAGHINFAHTNNWYVNPALLVGSSSQAMDVGTLLQTYASSNSLQISAVIRNDNGASPTAAIGFNVAASSGFEASASKGGVGFTRTGTQGRGYGSLYNRAASDRSSFDAADEVFRWTSSGVTVIGALELATMTSSGAAPSVNGGKLELVCGTASGTAKLQIYAGTSAVPTTILDNIGAGVAGCP